ncbi:MAG: hypothetical protein ACLR0U_18640 [Enterocloster clostridioformis]
MCSQHQILMFVSDNPNARRSWQGCMACPGPPQLFLLRELWKREAIYKAPGRPGGDNRCNQICITDKGAEKVVEDSVKIFRRIECHYV